MFRGTLRPIIVVVVALVLTVILAQTNTAWAQVVFLRGDADDSGRVDITDSIFTLDFLFFGGPDPVIGDAADANDDGLVDLSDPIAVLVSLFLGGGDLPPPGMLGIGPDPTPDNLDDEDEDPGPGGEDDEEGGEDPGPGGEDDEERGEG